jgi:hypothetical protein
MFALCCADGNTAESVERAGKKDILASKDEIVKIIQEVVKKDDPTPPKPTWRAEPHCCSCFFFGFHFLLRRQDDAIQNMKTVSKDDNGATAPPPPVVAVPQATPAEPATKESVTDAANAGRYAMAHAGMPTVGIDPKEYLDSEVIERINRIGSKFNETISMLQKKPADVKANEKNASLRLEWSVSVEGSIMEMISVEDYDCDIMKLIALDLQRSLENKIQGDDTVVNEIQGEPFAHDVCWRRRDNKNKLDDILMASCIDALDTPVKAICILKYSLPTAVTKLPGLDSIPAAQDGYERTPYIMIATSFAPLPQGGVRRIEVDHRDLPAGLAKALGVMPTFMLKKVVRGRLENEVKSINETLKSSSFDELVKAPHQEKFLEQLRQRIAPK